MSAPVLDRLGAELRRGQHVQFNPGAAYRTAAPEPHFGVVAAVVRETGLVLIRPEQPWYLPRRGGMSRMFHVQVDPVWAPRVPAWICRRGPRDATGEWVERVERA